MGWKIGVLGPPGRCLEVGCRACRVKRLVQALDIEISLGLVR